MKIGKHHIPTFTTVWRKIVADAKKRHKISDQQEKKQKQKERKKKEKKYAQYNRPSKRQN
jgi:hypothetical protein